MADGDKSFKERLRALLDEDGDDTPKKGDGDETRIVLTGKDALEFLGLGGSAAKDPPAGDGDDKKDPPAGDDTPKRGKGYFKGDDAQ